MRALRQFPSVCIHGAFTFSFCVFPGSNSSDWLRSVHGGDDFWSCWYSLVFQWLGGTWQMCLKGRTPLYHVRITLHCLWGLCASEPLTACCKHSQIRGALLTETGILKPSSVRSSLSFCWVSAWTQTNKRSDVWSILYLRFWTGEHFASPDTLLKLRPEMWGKGSLEDVSSQGLWLSQGQNTGGDFGCGIALKDMLHRQAGCTHGGHTTPSLFLLCCLWYNSIQCNLQNWQH